MGFGLVGKWLAAPFSPNNQVRKYLTLLACENAQVEGKGRGSDTKDFLERSRHKKCDVPMVTLILKIGFASLGAWEREVLEAWMKKQSKEIKCWELKGLD